MSNGLLFKLVKEMWSREWTKMVQARGAKMQQAMLQTCPSPAMLEGLVDMVAEDPCRPAAELEPVIHRMLFESQFIDDGGDSVMFDAFDCVEEQTHMLVKILEEVRHVGVRDGTWSTAPLAPMMFG